jgi:ABC-type multidrug transport system fused ATPase/permease subunit
MSLTSTTKYVLRCYGSLQGVWFGVLATTITSAFYKCGLAICVAWIASTILDRNTPKAFEYVGILAVALLAATIIKGIGDYIFVSSTDSRYKFLAAKFHHQLLSLPLSDSLNVSSGELSVRYRDHLDGTIAIVRIARNEVIPAMCAICFPILALLFLDYLIGISVLVVTILQAMLALYGGRRVDELRLDARKTYRRLSALVADHLVHIKLIRASTFESLLNRRVSALAEQEARLFWKRHLSVISQDTCKGILNAFLFAGVLYLAVWRNSNLQTATFIVVLSAMYLFQVVDTAAAYPDLRQRLAEHFMKVSSTIIGEPANDWRSAEIDQSPSHDLALAPNRLCFDDVCFAYAGTRASGDSSVVLDGVSFSISPGSRVAIVGLSGQGKSTIAQLILGFETPNSGRVLYGDVDISTIEPKRWLRNISYVPQSTELLDGTLRENLVLFNPSATESDIQEACAAACLCPVIERLDSGLDYQVGERGGRLSGGERQRVGIARALLRNSSVYLFDEATSDLDETTARLVLRNVSKQLAGRTILFITHSHLVQSGMDFALEVKDKRVLLANFQ